MRNASRARIVVPLLLALILLAGIPAFAQIDFTGVWTGNTNLEDGPERLAGPSLVEFLGLPINDQARQWGLAYRSSRLSLLEHQCQVHVVSYIHRGPFQARVWEERDPVTHQLIAIHEDISNYGQQRTIWMDGRPRPSKNAPHTHAGFTTGVWDGDALVAVATHFKMGDIKRHRAFSSDRATMTYRFTRQGNVLTLVKRLKE